MRNALAFSFAFTLLQFLLVVKSVDYGCSIFCTCDTWFGLKRATCANKRLYSIETGISGLVEAIDFSNNSISSLANYELAAAGLTKLRYLNLSENGINEIGLAAFAKLTELAVLDLSRNHLNYLLPDTFAQNTKLRILKLQRNNFNLHFPKLGSSSITDLDLSECLISYLPADAFSNLKELSKLDLSKNVMIQLNSKVLQSVPSLKTILLDRNPWSCNRVMQELQAYLLSRKVKFTLFCEFAGPKKFEKMIKFEAPFEKVSKLQPPLEEKTPKSEKGWDLDFIKEDNENTLKTLNTINFTRNLDDLENSIRNTSPYWFIGIGFLLGSASTLTLIYLWFSAALSCRLLRIQRRSPMGSINITSQRTSLLQNIWRYNEVDADDASESQICPGTPPPPYREVMLHRNLYPCARRD